MTAPDFGAPVAAVPHDDICDLKRGDLFYPPLRPVCTCDRDARIGRGIAAAVDVAFQCGLASDGNVGDWRGVRDAAAARAFEEASG